MKGDNPALRKEIAPIDLNALELISKDTLCSGNLKRAGLLGRIAVIGDQQRTGLRRYLSRDPCTGEVLPLRRLQ
jgi:hypothetical protein